VSTNRVVDGWVDGINRLGAQTEFYAKTIGSSREALGEYRIETLRLVTQMSLGSGTLAVIGGTIVIVGFLTLSAGALIAVQGYNLLTGIGVEALTGFMSAFFNVRIMAPLVSGIGMAATIGAGATAQLGAMRINEEIDALEVIGIRGEPRPTGDPGGQPEDDDRRGRYRYRGTRTGDLTNRAGVHRAGA
jgi:phospholipid/cholesterol/gamma-HCH transport system permease protein